MPVQVPIAAEDAAILSRVGHRNVVPSFPGPLKLDPCHARSAPTTSSTRAPTMTARPRIAVRTCFGMHLRTPQVRGDWVCSASKQLPYVRRIIRIFEQMPLDPQLSTPLNARLGRGRVGGLGRGTRRGRCSGRLRGSSKEMWGCSICAMMVNGPPAAPSHASDFGSRSPVNLLPFSNPPIWRGKKKARASCQPLSSSSTPSPTAGFL